MYLRGSKSGYMPGGTHINARRLAGRTTVCSRFAGPECTTTRLDWDCIECGGSGSGQALGLDIIPCAGTRPG